MLKSFIRKNFGNSDANLSLDDFRKLTLDPLGWTRSVDKGEPVDREGKPLPWWTYPSIDFISRLLQPTFKVFEYGCGNSTLWLSQRVQRVESIEHDPKWYGRVVKQLAGEDNTIVNLVRENEPVLEGDTKLANLYFTASPRNDFGYGFEKTVRRGVWDEGFIAYASRINKIDDDFDCIIIDGMARRLCCYYAVEKLKPNGFIIFDNSNRSDYIEGYKFLRTKGFFNIPFWGNVPGAPFPSCTSVFVKDAGPISKITFENSYFSLPEY